MSLRPLAGAPPGVRGVSLLLVSLALLGALTGCRDSPSVGTVRAEIERQIPGARFEKEFQLTLGRFSLGLTRRLAGWALAGEEDVSSLMKNVRRVDVGSYRVVSLPPLEEIEAPSSLARRLDASGWSLVVGSYADDERVWMYVRQGDDGGIGGIYVVVLDEYELTMVALTGRLDELLAEAIAADPVRFAASLAS